MVTPEEAAPHVFLAQAPQGLPALPAPVEALLKSGRSAGGFKAKVVTVGTVAVTQKISGGFGTL